MNLNQYSNTVNPLINARGVYFIFQIWRGRLLEGGVYQRISLIHHSLNADKVNFLKVTVIGKRNRDRVSSLRKIWLLHNSNKKISTVLDEQLSKQKDNFETLVCSLFPLMLKKMYDSNKRPFLGGGVNKKGALIRGRRLFRILILEGGVY